MKKRLPSKGASGVGGEGWGGGQSIPVLSLVRAGSEAQVTEAMRIYVFEDR